jgi:hypothetical protein
VERVPSVSRPASGHQREVKFDQCGFSIPLLNQSLTILVHMTGRQGLRRPGYDIDIEKVLAACAEHGVAVEINANPWRLDLDWRWHETALRLGCIMSINPDAHSTREIDLTHWGVEMARKGGVPKQRVLNCLTKEEFATYLEGRRERRLGKRSMPLPRISRARAVTAAQRNLPLRPGKENPSQDDPVLPARLLASAFWRCVL